MEHRRRFSAFVASGQSPRPTIVEATDFARELVNQSGLSDKTKVKTLIVVEELVSNVLRHSDPAQDVHLTLCLDTEKDAITVEIDDDSVAFDASLEHAFSGPDPIEGGSVGLAIVRAWSENITYVREGNRNRLTLTVR